MESVFVIEDDIDTLETFGVLLDILGFKAECYNSLDLAYSRITKDHPCLILMDWHSYSEIRPEEFIYNVRKNFPALPIVIVSGDFRIRERAEELKVGFILKPPDLSMIESFCKQHCPRP